MSRGEERVRRMSSVLVRRTAFAKEVIDAYGGRCGMCGLNLGLIEAAHVYPAHAPASPDDITNGLALCRNHHGAFDQHRVWIDPASSDLRVHPEWVAAARESDVSHAFVSGYLSTLRLPPAKKHRPDPQYLRRRYKYFGDSYAWARG